MRIILHVCCFRYFEINSHANGLNILLYILYILLIQLYSFYVLS